MDDDRLERMVPRVSALAYTFVRLHPVYRRRRLDTPPAMLHGMQEEDLGEVRFNHEGILTGDVQ